jgi:MFS superfamily sulfate permease-like transporter
MSSSHLPLAEDGTADATHATPRRQPADQLPDHRPIFVVAAEPITDVDTTAADMLEELDEALNAQGISLVVADMKDPARAKIERYELIRTIDPAHFFPTVGAAVAAFQDQFGADWGPSTAPGPLRERSER